MSDARATADWASTIAAAYAADTRPPLTDDLVARVRDELAAGFAGAAGDDAAMIESANATLDAFELALRSVVGPRVDSLDAASSAPHMKHRSEAGQPLRAFGGQ
jgi:hypothetical protein